MCYINSTYFEVATFEINFQLKLILPSPECERFIFWTFEFVFVTYHGKLSCLYYYNFKKLLKLNFIFVITS